MRNILRERRLLKYIDSLGDINEYNEEEDQQALAEIQFSLGNSQLHYPQLRNYPRSLGKVEN